MQFKRSCPLKPFKQTCFRLHYYYVHEGYNYVCNCSQKWRKLKWGALGGRFSSQNTVGMLEDLGTRIGAALLPGLIQNSTLPSISSRFGLPLPSTIVLPQGLPAVGKVRRILALAQLHSLAWFRTQHCPPSHLCFNYLYIFSLNFLIFLTTYIESTGKVEYFTVDPYFGGTFLTGQKIHPTFNTYRQLNKCWN